MTDDIRTITLDEGMWQELLELTDGAVAPCFQCGVCTAICPWGEARSDGFSVRSILRAAQLGELEQLEPLWLCSGCLQCEASCPRGVEISKVMQSVGRYYVQYFNYTYQRTGTLWEGRYRATLLDTDQYLLTCYRYIELNPVRAEMVENPANYPWSSYRFNAQGMPDPLVVPHALYWKLGHDPQERQAAYRALFRGQLDESALAEIREATNKAWLLGNDRFRAAIEQQLNRRPAPRPRGGDRRSRSYRERTA